MNNNLLKEFRNGDFVLSTDKSRLDISLLHNFLTNSYWAKGVSMDSVKTMIENSLCFGLYHQARQIGFASVLTDFSRVAHLYNLFIIEEFRGRGLAIWMLNIILNLEEIKVRRWMLGTRDLHPLYAKFGFTALKEPGRLMEKWE